MKSRFAKKVDRSQAAIVKALRKIGAQVEVTNMGNDFPDLLCGYFLRWKLLEVKELDGKFSRGQLEFLRDANAPVDIVISEDDALYSMRYNRSLDLTEQSHIRKWIVNFPYQETIRVPKLLKMIGRTPDLNAVENKVDK